MKKGIKKMCLTLIVVLALSCNIALAGEGSGTLPPLRVGVISTMGEGSGTLPPLSPPQEMIPCGEGSGTLPPL